jgi:DNA polymerase (family 10)
MSNYEIARIFTRIADLMEVQGDNPFKIRAYRKAADTIEGLTESLESIAERGALETVPNIGKGIAEKIDEIVRTGTASALEVLRARVPEGLPEILNISGLGPRTVQTLHAELGIASIDDLERAARAGRIRELPGMGTKTEENILHGIEGYRRRSERWPLGKALPYAENLVAALRAAPGLERLEIAGSLRRMRDTIGDVDLVGTARTPRAVMEAFARLPQARETLLSGDTRTSIVTHEGLQVDLRLVKPEEFGALLHHFTGSRDHNIRLREMAEARGVKINEYGVFDVKTGEEINLGGEEADLYRFLGLPYIPPELREDRGEIEAARAGKLPHLIEAGDIRGNLHGHTDWSDGAATLEVMVAAARELGHEYIAITDHSKTLGVAGGLDEERLRRQMAAIDALTAASPGIRVLKGIEVDILADGTLDLDPDLLNTLDVVVGSVHSHFKQDAETITARMIRAMESGCVDIIAHPTGRLIGHRDPYAVDVQRLIDAAVATKTALEINANPERLDLNDVYARRARDRGALISINTDAHHPNHFNLLPYGIATARRAWLEAEDVLNTWPLERLLAWLATRATDR